MTPAPTEFGAARLIHMDDGTAWLGWAPVLVPARPSLGTIQSATQASLELSGQEEAWSLCRGLSLRDTGDRKWRGHHVGAPVCKDRGEHTAVGSQRLSCSSCVSSLWKETGPRR